MTRPLTHDPRDYFVEWQITAEPGTFIDLADEGSETEVVLAEPSEIRTTSGR
jgi:hypothetical protein